MTNDILRVTDNTKVFKDSAVTYLSPREAFILRTSRCWFEQLSEQDRRKPMNLSCPCPKCSMSC